jgi:signal transduction histidine kinase/ligand-binding sensor domain-containing protein/CheY-like chemotaxis protein
MIGIEQGIKRMRHTLFTRWILVAAVFLAAVTPVRAGGPMPPKPTPQFRAFGLHEGLPSSKVKAVAQDAHGFIWVATAMGLARFDGVEFTVPGIGAERDHAMPAGPLSALHIGHDDRIWIGGPDIGLARYDPATGGFVQWRDGLSDDDVRAVTQSTDGSIWVGTSKGLDRMRPDGSGFEHLASHAGGLSSTIIRALQATDDGRVWVAGDAGVDVIDAKGHPQAVAFADGSAPRVTRIESSNGELHFATDAGVYRLADDGRIHRDERVAPQHVRGSLVDSHGTVWIATLDGLSMIDRYGRSHVIADSWTAPGGLPGRTVSDMIEDREHGLWFALSDGGLAYLGPGWEDFTRFAHVPTDPSSFPGRAVTAVAAHGDRELWVGGFRGWIRRFDPASGRASGGFDLGASRVQSLFETSDGRLLAGMADGLSIAGENGAEPLFRSMIDHAVTSIAAAPDGALYVAASGQGLFVLDPALTTAGPLPFAEVRRGATDTRQVEIVDGVLWQSSVAGLARFDRNLGQMRYVEGVAPGRVSAFEPDRDGFWLIRPEALEHYLWDGERARLAASVGSAQGFPSADILNLRKDITGRFWLYGQTGVWRFDPEPGIFRSFGVADGLANGEFTNATTVLLADGTMYGATLGGLVGFRPDQQRDHVRRPAIVVLGASVSESGTRRALPIVDNTLHLGWRDHDLSIRTRALSYVNPERNHVGFSLDQDGAAAVMRTGRQGERNFGLLDPGVHRLSIFGEESDAADGSPVPLTIIVDAPPWRRWWAWLIYMLLILALVGGSVLAARRRVRHALRLRLAEQQQRLAEEANAAKTEFMATLGHEIRTPMTGVLGMAELMAQTPLDATQRGYVDAVRRSGTTLLRLVNDALDITRIESRRLQLESECVSLRLLADEVIALASGTATEKGLRLSVQVDPDVPPAIRGDGIRLRQILQNLVNNAVKFTETGSVSLRLSRDQQTLSMTVCDTGPGIAEELRGRLFSRFEQGGSPQRAQGSGLGLAICHELCTLMGGNIVVGSQPGEGSTFNVSLPLRACACHGRSCAVSTSSEPRGAGQRLLLVEDDAVIAEVMAALLGQRGHRVTVVGDGLAAMAEVSCNTYDVLLLDLDLPLVDGFQVARMVRRLPAVASLPIVAVTARSTGDEVKAIREAGMNALLRKPMTGDALETALATVLAATPQAGQERASRIA